ncbi:MAG: hypothetical protein IIC63_06650, partial [Proteobacteria bacterium]|nr:hypothetical protein [Pseudomonadota bacterium]
MNGGQTLKVQFAAAQFFEIVGNMNFIASLNVNIEAADHFTIRCFVTGSNELESTEPLGWNRHFIRAIFELLIADQPERLAVQVSE